jgi:hypothetical protein
MTDDQAFDEILQRSLQRLLAGEPESLILSSVPEHAAALSPLLQTALELKQWNLPRLSARARERVRARALHKFRSSIVPPQGDAGYILAILQFDSARRAPVVGMRRGSGSMRQLVFGVQDYAVDLRVNQDGGTWTLKGQVLGLSEGGYVELRDAEAVTQTKLEEMGMFTLPHVLPGSYTLTLYLGQLVVQLPPLEVGA